jgi:thioredoxin reductase (NADPH)
MSEIREVIIIGSGPSGYAAAIYTARAGLRPLLFEGALTAGGALMTTTEVENFPGFPEGVMGPDLMFNMRAQAEKFGTEIITDDIAAVELTGSVKTTTDSEGHGYSAKAVVLAMGSGYRRLGLADEDRLSGRGVSWCATCDGFFFRDKDIAVVGGGDSALEEATFLTRFAKSVTLIHRRDELRGSKIMVERAKADPKIKFAWNSQIVELVGEQLLSSITLADTATGATRSIDASGLFVAIGHDPRSEIVRGQVELDPAGYVKVASPTTLTNLDGVFACGDLVDHTYRQAITAAGSGCAAALDAERYLAALSDATASLASANSIA